MHPVLIDLGGFELHSYGILGAVAFLAVSFAALRRARGLGWPQDSVVDVIFWAAVAALVGSRALWVAQNPGAIRSLVDAVNLRVGGLVFYGAFAGLPVGAWVARRRGLPVLHVADVFAPLLAAGHAISRVGCFLAGCCYGRAFDGPWRVVFTDPRSVAPHDVGLHPVQLYEAAGLAALAGLVLAVRARAPGPGRASLAYVGGYAVLRSVTEVFRGDADRYFVLEAWLGPTVSTSQAIAAGLLVAVAVAARRLPRTA